MSPSSPTTTGGGGRHWSDLPRDLLADIHGRLRFTDRLAFTAVFGDLFIPEAPWLVIPEDPSLTYYKTAFFSLADRRAITVCSLPLRNSDVLLGSSGGWLAMADKEGRMHLINPVTGKQHMLPAITTMVGFNVSSFSDPGTDSINGFSFDKDDFLAIRFSRGPYPERHPKSDLDKPWRRYAGTVYIWSPDMRKRVYHKVVLSASPRPSSYAAMLIVVWKSYTVSAFATAEDPAWRAAPPRDDVVDAVYHRGRFYSFGRTGVVEAWDEKELTSEVVASGLSVKGGKRMVTTPDDRLMVVSWDVVRGHACSAGSSSKDSFKMHVLDEASGSWQETNDIGQAAVLIGAANNVMCVSTRDHQNLTGNCVYFTNALKREVGVYSLRHRTLTKIEEFKVAARWTSMWKAAAWFTPSFP